MTPYQIILFMLKMLAEIREEYPVDLLAARRAAFIADLEKRKAASAHAAFLGDLSL